MLRFAPQSVLQAAQRTAPQLGHFGKVRQRRFETLLLDCLDILASARNKELSKANGSEISINSNKAPHRFALGSDSRTVQRVATRSPPEMGGAEKYLREKYSKRKCDVATLFSGVRWGDYKLMSGD